MSWEKEKFFQEGYEKKENISINNEHFVSVKVCGTKEATISFYIDKIVNKTKIEIEAKCIKKTFIKIQFF